MAVWQFMQNGWILNARACCRANVTACDVFKHTILIWRWCRNFSVSTFLGPRCSRSSDETWSLLTNPFGHVAERPAQEVKSHWLLCFSTVFSFHYYYYLYSEPQICCSFADSLSSNAFLFNVLRLVCSNAHAALFLPFIGWFLFDGLLKWKL